MVNNHFDVLLLTARPAAGKSEVIHFLKSLPQDQLKEKYHLAPFRELDDFPMLWTWFEEDDLVAKMGHPRLHTDGEGYFLHQYLWDLLIHRLGMDYAKLLRDNPDFHLNNSVLIEFSRGKEHGGYRSAFHNLSEKLVSRMAILYIDVSWEESLRKNKKRFNPDKPDSILQHSLPDEKMERLYKATDWSEVAPDKKGYTTIGDFQVPYVVMDNEDDVTTRGGILLSNRLENSISELWMLYNKKPVSK